MACWDIWNSELRHLPRETFSQLIHTIRYHIKSKLSFQGFKAKLNIKISQLNQILENAINIEYLKFSCLTVISDVSPSINATNFVNLKGLELHDDHEGSSKGTDFNIH